MSGTGDKQLTKQQNNNDTFYTATPDAQVRMPAPVTDSTYDGPTVALDKSQSSLEEEIYSVMVGLQNLRW